MSAQAPTRTEIDVDLPVAALTRRDRHPRPEPRTVAREAPVGPGRGKTAVAIGLGLVLALFGSRCWQVARADAITSDETTHLTHCLHYWAFGDDLTMWELGAPRLPHALNALPSYLALRPLAMLGANDKVSMETLVLSGNNRVLLPARAVAIAWGIALIGVIFWATARRLGAVLGLIAAAIASMVPEILAHSSIAGSDVPFTTSALIALVLLARYAEEPGPGRWLAASLAVGLAWAMRHTALLLLPMAAIVHLVVHVRRDRPIGPLGWLDRLLGSGTAGLVLATIAYLGLWAGDGLGTVTLAGVSERVTTLNVPDHIGPIDISGVPIPTSILSILKQTRHQNIGHEAYFCGAVGQEGWTAYFPVAFLLKTPTGLIALLILAAVRVRPKGAWDAIALGFLGLLWIMLLRNRVNIGVRYALLTYPLTMPFVARLFSPSNLRDRVWGPATVAATAWLVVASTMIPGRYLSYFNEVGGGPSKGWIYLADSNVDWGQDFNALEKTLDRLRIGEVTTDLSTQRRLAKDGRMEFVNPSKAEQVHAVAPPNRRLHDSEGGYIPVYTRYVAVGVSRLLGLYSRNDMSWLRTRKVVARVGDGTFLFDMDLPADRPFFDEDRAD